MKNKMVDFGVKTIISVTGKNSFCCC